jgi:chaperonin GroEL (HSP60 family)
MAILPSTLRSRNVSDPITEVLFHRTEEQLEAARAIADARAVVEQAGKVMHAAAEEIARLREQLDGALWVQAQFARALEEQAHY